jgi:predicted porin
LKKSLITAAVLTAFAGAASAQVTLYGLIDASYGKSLLGDVFLDQKADFHSGGDNGNSEGNSTTRVGIKGSTDVGGGLKANFRFESNGITSDGDVNSPKIGRQAWLGFSGGFGEVRLGRQDSVSFQTMIDFDFNGASNGVSAGGYASVGPWLPGRQSRSLQYISPSISGATVQLGFQPEGNGGPGAKNVFSAGAKFGAGPLLLGASVQTKATETGKNFYSVAGSYDLGVVKGSLSYADGGKFAEGGSGKGIVAGLVAPVAGFNVGGHYAINNDDALKIKSLELFVNREIFKNTIAYVELGDWKTDLAVNPLAATGKTSGTGFAVGVIYVF